MNTKRSSQKKCLAGFTLVELLVSSAIFSSVIVIATGALFSAQAINTRLQQTHIILDGVNLYGSAFHCGDTYTEVNFEKRKNCPLSISPVGTVGRALIFRPSDAVDVNDRDAYFIENNIIYKNSCIANGGACVWGTPAQITGSNVRIDTLSFFVSGANTAYGDTEDDSSQTDTLQPVVTVIIGGTTLTAGTKTTQPVKFRVQSTSVARGIDN